MQIFDYMTFFLKLKRVKNAKFFHKVLPNIKFLHLSHFWEKEKVKTTFFAFSIDLYKGMLLFSMFDKLF